MFQKLKVLSLFLKVFEAVKKLSRKVESFWLKEF